MTSSTFRTSRNIRASLLGAALACAALAPVAASAQQPTTVMGATLKKFNVTVRRFNPARGIATGQDFVLPVDSPDEEHAISAAMSNAVAFTEKMGGAGLLPVAFTCVNVAPRP